MSKQQEYHQKNMLERLIEMAGNTIPILTIVFLGTYYYFSTKFADLEAFYALKDKVSLVQKDISLLQQQDVAAITKITVIDTLETRLRECERKINLVIGKDDRPLPSDITLELKGEITVLKMMIENLKQELKNTHP